MKKSLYTTHILNNEAFSFERCSTRSSVVKKSESIKYKQYKVYTVVLPNYTCNYATTLLENMDPIKGENNYGVRSIYTNIYLR